MGRAQDELATQCGNLIVSLLKHNSRSKLINTSMYPGAFAMLADQREEVRAHCLSQMAVHWDAFHTAKLQRAPFWVARVRRSCMALPLVEDIMELALRSGFKDQPVLVALAEAMFKGVNFSHLVEDHNRRQRAREEQAQCGKLEGVVGVVSLQGDQWLEPSPARGGEGAEGIGPQVVLAAEIRGERLVQAGGRRGGECQTAMAFSIPAVVLRSGVRVGAHGLGVAQRFLVSGVVLPLGAIIEGWVRLPGSGLRGVVGLARRCRFHFCPRMACSARGSHRGSS